MYRTYTFLLRDYHLYLLCLESKWFDSVEYSLATDLKKGVDLVVGKAGKIWNLKLHSGSERANEYSGDKAVRNPNDFFEIVLSNKGEKRVGKFDLYTLDRLKGRIKERMICRTGYFSE